MTARTKIIEVLNSGKAGQSITVCGWVRTFRSNRFIALNDGSTIDNIQIVIDFENTDEAILKQISTGACIKINGELTESIGSGQAIEIKANEVIILGVSDETYPLQPKKHSLEFLREKAHLRFRTNTFSAIFRLRHSLSFAVHEFFNKKGFVHMHTPIITASDAEGAGEMFRVSTLDAKNPPLNDDGTINYKEDFFGRSANLTVSGQLEGELAAMAFADIYTFGPTFRAENSNTPRHLAEFWMIEPEMAFYELADNMELAEEFIKYVINYALTNNKADLAFLAQRLIEEDKSKPEADRNEMGLLEKLELVVNNPFEKVTYTEAIEILLQSLAYKKKKFKFPVGWGLDMQSEHERYLVEKHFKKPVIVTNYPKEIKSFYMRQNDDGKTVAAMDILVPGIGELVGGSQREERLDVLTARMTELNIPTEDLWWYLDTRRYGACKHAGFGLGFERLVLFVTGMSNIRDVIAFPRTPNNAEF